MNTWGGALLAPFWYDVRLFTKGATFSLESLKLCMSLIVISLETAYSYPRS